MIKTIISDQDGTFYVINKNDELHPLTLEARTRTKKWIQSNLGIKDEDIDNFYQKLAKTHPNPYLGFPSIGLPILSRQRRNEPNGILGYHDILDELPVSQFIERDELLVKEFSQITIPVYVATLASPGKYSYDLQEALGIRSVLRETFCPYDVPNADVTKGPIYTHIMKLEGVKPNEVLILGDSYTNDLAIGIELGCHVALINASDSFMPELYHDTIYGVSRLLKLLNNKGEDK